MFTLPKTICRFNAFPMKRSMAFFTEVEKNSPKIYMEPQRNLINQSNLEKQQQSWRHNAP